jgi:hypothetical protein
MRKSSNHIILFGILLTLNSCFSHSDTHRENDKIFLAGPSSGGIGALYFGLYKDHTYQICASSGIGQDCYSGEFVLNGDTVTLTGLDKKINIKYNRLVILRYSQQDSNYWKWKYAKPHLRWNEWKQRDSGLGTSGDVYEIDQNNRLDKNEIHFVIELDSLKQYF